MRFMLVSALFAAAVLSGCSNPDSPSRRDGVDVGAAASRAERDIANYAAIPAQSATADGVERSAPVVATPAPAAAAPALLADDAPPEAVARRYGEALAARRYDAAWALWDAAGASAGMSRAALAAQFEPYTKLRVAVGTPFDADAGAGQRYVSVLVTFTGSMRDGAPLRRTATLVLHKAADGIDSDEPHAHAWRIRSSEWQDKAEPGETVAR